MSIRTVHYAIKTQKDIPVSAGKGREDGNLQYMRHRSKGMPCA